MQNDIFFKKLQDESDRLSLAEQLVGIRKDAKLTQAALAKRIGLPLQLVDMKAQITKDTK